MKRVLPIVAMLIIAALLLAGCDPDQGMPGHDTAGFVLGFFHGALWPLFLCGLATFPLESDGGYVIGFFIGFLLIWGGGGTAVAASK